MLTFNANWKRVFAKDSVQPVFLVTIGNGSIEGVDKWTAVSGDRSLFSYPNAVADVSPVAGEIDVEERDFKLSNLSVTFHDDGWLRSVIKLNRIARKYITIKRGAVDLVEDDFEPYAKQIIHDWEPTDDGKIVLKCRPTASKMIGVVAKEYVNRHPYEILKDLLVLGEVPTGDYDATSLDPETDGTISHWAVSRLKHSAEFSLTTGVGEQEEIKDLFSDVLKLVLGAWIQRPTGVYKLSRYNPNKAVDRNLVAGDIRNVKPITAVGNIKNQWHVPYAQHIDSSGKQNTWGSVVKKDPNSVADHGLLEKVFWSKYLNSLNKIVTDIETTDGDGATFRIAQSLWGLSGANWNGTLNGRYSNIDVSTAYVRKAYIMVGLGSGNAEIIKVKNITPVLGTTHVTDAAGTRYFRLWECTIEERGAFDTFVGRHESNAGAPGKTCCDVTIGIDIATTQLNRFTNGCPIVEIETNVEHADLEEADFISFPSAVYLNYSQDGSDSTLIWEIISRRDFKDHLKFRLALVRTEVVASPTYPVTALEPVQVILADRGIITSHDQVVGATTHPPLTAVYDNDGNRVWEL